MTPRARVRGLAAVTAVALLVGWAFAPAGAATPERAPAGAVPETGTDDLGLSRNQVIVGIQSALADLGVYRGRIDGRHGPRLDAAIRTYQRQAGLAVDGRASRELLRRLRARGEIQGLLRRLDRVRDAHIEDARQALLSRPETRHLVAPPGRERPDADRDPQTCFADPTPACLLHEAAENAKAVTHDERRDWAFGEILAAQARAGLAAEAITSVERIGDLRLILTALRDIARGQAEAGRFEAARAAAQIVPDAAARMQAEAAIAEAEAAAAAERGTDAARRAAAAGAQQLAESARRLDDPVLRVEVVCRMAVALSGLDAADAARAVLAEAERLAGSGALAAAPRGAALRVVAATHARLGDPQAALAVLERIDDEGDPTPVLVAAATAQAEAGDPEAARRTARAIDAERYRVVVLARIAVAEARHGALGAARATLAQARTAAAGVRYPYARAYALSQVALAQAEIGAVHAPAFDDAVATARAVDDERLRAETLWIITAARRHAGDGPGADATLEAARAATAEVANPLSRTWMLADAARRHHALAAGGEGAAAFAAALDVARTITDPWSRARALAKLADTLSALR